ncbi:MAG: molecular chaperone DnaK, partial [Clostridiales bacterium]|nr:molecular chaperone DnaK [Clostridiales bacterium]
LHNQAEVLAYKVDEALSKCKKELDKDEKNRIKTDLANLRRCLRKDKPEKMNENEEAALRQAKTQLEESANHLMVLYTSEQGTDGTNNAL